MVCKERGQHEGGKDACTPQPHIQAVMAIRPVPFTKKDELNRIGLNWKGAGKETGARPDSRLRGTFGEALQFLFNELCVTFWAKLISND